MSTQHPINQSEFSDLPEEERELMEALRQNIQQVRPNPRYAAQLERELAEQSTNLPSQGAKAGAALASALKTLAWGGLSLVLVLGLVWVLQNTRQTALKPTSTSGAELSAANAYPSPAEPTGHVQIYEDYPAQPANPYPSPAEPTPTPAQAVYSPYLPNDRLILQTSLPDGPASLPVYQLQAGTALTVQNAQAKARQLGIENGKVYTPPSEGGGPVLIVTDGVQQVLFLGSADTFFFDADILTAAEATLNLPPVEQQISAAETWLKARSLLDFPYTVSADPGMPGQVIFAQNLDGLTLVNGQQQPVGIRVSINEAGLVKRVESARPVYTQAAELHLRSAAEAWAAIQTGDPSSFETSSPVEIYAGWPLTSTVQTWGRRYPAGQPIQMFGYLTILPSAEGRAALVTFNNYPLTGDTANLLQNARMGQFLHLMGSVENNPTGGQVFKVTGWQISNFPDENFEGTLEHQAGETYLDTAGRGRLRLPDAPAGLQTSLLPGVLVSVRGILLDGSDPQIDWMYIQSGGTGSGGGGGGSGFKELNLTGQGPDNQPSPTAAPGPGSSAPAEGTSIEGMMGYPTMTIHQYLDGTSSSEIFIALAYNTNGAAGQPALLTLGQGTGLTGSGPDENLADYLRLPVLVWGIIGPSQNGMPILNVERFEPVYPGLHYQAYPGTYAAVSLENRTVLLFTTQSGAQYVLDSSIDFGAEAAAGRPGDLIIVEGAVFPDRSFGGYPILTESGASMVFSQAEIDNYQVTAGAPDIVLEEASPAGRELVIDHVELVYYAPDLRGVGYSLPSGGNPLYIQPAWRFTGRYTGRYTGSQPVEILVQAAAPEYVK